MGTCPSQSFPGGCTTRATSDLTATTATVTTSLQQQLERMNLIVMLSLMSSSCVGISYANYLPPNQQQESEASLAFPEGVQQAYPHPQISREDLMEYLAALKLREMEGYPGITEQDNGPMKIKRGWGRNRWGNKYADNKSYGFWITALNKAGNYKRGKRGEPFVPGLSSAEPPFNIIRALKGGNTAPLKELVADHDYTEEQNTN